MSQPPCKGSTAKRKVLRSRECTEQARCPLWTPFRMDDRLSAKILYLDVLLLLLGSQSSDCGASLRTRKHNCNMH
eukprot:1934613-Amphidinium_carterae.1